MKKYLLLSFLLAALFLNAQMPSLGLNGVIEIKKENFQLTMTPFGRNIVKVTVLPKGYKKNEQISDAVAIKPIKTSVKIAWDRSAEYTVSWGGVKFAAKGDTFFFGNKRNALVATPLSNGDYNGFKFLLSPDEKIFGAGERALPLDRRGYKLNLYNNPWYGYGIGADNLNFSVPFITSSNNYALLFDNASKSYLDIGKTDLNVLEYGAMSGELNFYIIQANSYADILSSYHQLTGKQPVPPRWALGNFLSRFGYTSEAEVKDIMQKMKTAAIPYDAVIFDLFWFGDSIKGTMGNLDWVNKTAWPDPARMINDFTKDGTKTILITEPFVVNTSSNYEASKPFNAVDSAGKQYILKDFYFGRGGLIDIFRKESRDWFWSKYKPQMNKGVEGWWGDLGEPERHPSDLYHNLSQLGYKRLFKADEVHNMYGHYWTKMLFDKYASEYPEKRLFSLNRSGFAGTQRYGIFPWTGDVSRSWKGLQAQLPVLLGMSMSGVPYVHSDAGGFAGGEKDPELYIRWLQFAQYTPIFRPHGTELTKVDTASTSYPSEPALFEEPYQSMAKQVVLDRYALMPYNYTLAYKQATEGKPLISPLYYYFSKDTNTYNVQDEMMWGENILVAPVLEKGTTERKIFLPAGKWYNIATNKVSESGWITEPITMSAIPVFVKEGSFIPRNNKTIMNTTTYNTSDITITYYPSRQFSTYTLFDDDGNTNKSIEKNLFELITFETDGMSNETSFTIRSNGGKFSGKPNSRKINFKVPGISAKPAAITINNVAVSEKNGSNDSSFNWDEDKKLLTIHFNFNGDTVQLKLQ